MDGSRGQVRRLWEVVCMNNTVYMLRHRTTTEIILNYSIDLVQIHKRHIVNINHIKKKFRMRIAS